MHTFHPRVQVVLRRGDIALIRRLNSGIWFAESHRPFGKRSVDCVLGCGAKPNPLISKTGCDTACDHRLQHVAGSFEADAMQQLAAHPYVLESAQIAAFVVHTRESVTHELLRDESESIAIALLALFRREGSTGSDALDGVSGEIGDASGQVTCLVPVVRAAGRVRRLLG